jgi:hypothetical protein
MRVLLALLLVAAPLVAHAQQQYAGTLGKQPVHLVLEAYGDGVVVAMYVYDRHDTPIPVNGEMEDGALVLREKGADLQEAAVLRFEGFTVDAAQLQGQWIPTGGGKPLPIRLEKEVDIRYSTRTFAPVALLQPASTADHYFKVVAARTADDRKARTIAVEVRRKREDSLVQRLEVDTEFRGLHGIGTGDFNFDGIEDFSLFEAGYAGPNTTSLYFLRDSLTGQYALSGIAGTSLEFDAAAKRVREHNQCCAGTSHINATYRVVGNRLELESQQCLQYSEAEQDLVEVPCEPEEDRD